MVTKSLASWKQLIWPLEFQFPIARGIKKKVQRWHEGTRLPIRQLRKQHYKTVTLIGVATLVPQVTLLETPLYTED